VGIVLVALDISGLLVGTYKSEPTSDLDQALVRFLLTRISYSPDKRISREIMEIPYPTDSESLRLTISVHRNEKNRWMVTDTSIDR
jgi:hypothetical protein